MGRAYFLPDIASYVCELVVQHRHTWQDEPDERWLKGMVEEVGELASALAGRHEHTPDYELRQIAAIAINWLAERKSREGMMNENELKPCPFCAHSSPELSTWIVFAGMPSEHKEFALVCRNCGASGPNDLGESGAIEMWNLRRESWPPERKVEP